MGCCAGVLLLSGAPRFALFLMWIFGWDRMSQAIDSFVLGFLGFLFLPYTMVFYLLAFQPSDGLLPAPGVSGIGWFFVALGFVIDISSYTSGGAAQRRRAEAA